MRDSKINAPVAFGKAEPSVRSLRLLTALQARHYFFESLFWGIPAQASGKNHVAINAFGAPIRPASVLLRHIIASSMLTPLTLPQMTRRRFGCNSRPPLALRTTGAQNYLRLSRTTSPRFAFYGWQR